VKGGKGEGRRREELWKTKSNIRRSQAVWRSNADNFPVEHHAGICTCEIKSGIAMAKAAFNRKRALFTSFEMW
jgi:hypothetical protein